MAFVSSNIVLILGILGAAITLVASLTKTVQQKPSIRVAVVLLVLGFVTLVAQQLMKAELDAQGAEQRALAEQNREAILAAISSNVQHTASVVDDISQRLATASLDDVGVPLIAVDNAARGGEPFLSYGKGPASAWEEYTRFLAASRNSRGKTFLTFDVNASNHYVVGLTLAYLLAAPETAAELRPVVARGADGPWLKTMPLVDRSLLDWKGVDYVLFRDGRSRQVLAYASARDFANELVQHERLGNTPRVEAALNAPQADVVKALAELFPSMRSSVITNTADVGAVVKTMIDRQWSQSLVHGPAGQFIVALESVVRLAETGV
ncbi:MAG TPA: hypothetical protein VF405_00070 [Gammaproteobacteria bacterium]